MIKRCFLLCLSMFLMQITLAQKVVVSGIVTDEYTGRPVPMANVRAERGGESVVTNDDGVFVLKTSDASVAIVVTHLGYQSQRIGVHVHGTPVSVRLKPATVALKEVVVKLNEPRQLVNIAIKKIPKNYSTQPESYECFYRETAMKRQHYIYVAEGVVDMYKTGYDRSTARDRVAIRKGRRLVSSRQSDTLGVKVMGGPVQPIQLDVVKNTDFLLNAEELDAYSFSMGVPTTIGDRQQFVVEIAPRWEKPYPLFFGKLYIDCETLAFTRAELTLDMHNREKATSYMLIRKPFGVKFKPKELSCTIDYQTDADSITRISYIRNVFRFNCDWKKRLLATSFTATCEMVVTGRSSDHAHPISGHASFDTHEAFYDQVNFFRDPDFWEDYNIIEPSERLDKAIGKILKRY